MNNLNEFRTPRRTTGVRTAVRLTLASTSLAVMALVGVAQQSEQPGRCRNFRRMPGHGGLRRRK